MQPLIKKLDLREQNLLKEDGTTTIIQICSKMHSKYFFLENGRNPWARNLQNSNILYALETISLTRRQSTASGRTFYFRQRFMSGFWNVQKLIEKGIEDLQNPR